jgi:sigma-B regulation protein RsbU (phosphoserine phosphatase)
VDVSGHGVASAMMTARLAGLLSGESPDHNLALATAPDGRRIGLPPEEVAARFNRLMIEDFQVDQYFTLAYADIHLPTGRVRLVQAGHPHPMILRRDGRVEVLGQGGLPIGLIDGAGFQRIEARLGTGDRLILLSDGVTECPSPDGRDFDTDLLSRFLSRHAELTNAELLESLVWALEAHADRAEFPDDVSGILFRYTP